MSQTEMIMEIKIKKIKSKATQKEGVENSHDDGERKKEDKT